MHKYEVRDMNIEKYFLVFETSDFSEQCKFIFALLALLGNQSWGTY